MSVLMSSLLNAVTPRSLKKADRTAPTHETMLPEHERRKGEELRHRIGHGHCFVGSQRIC